MAAVVALALFYQGATLYGDPSSEMQRFRQPSAPLPHVLVKGTLVRRSTQDLPALAVIEHEHYESCGKHFCWALKDSFHYSNAAVKVEWSSAPLPERVTLDWSFKETPWRFPSDVADPARANAWIAFAEHASIGFGMPKPPLSILQQTQTDHRIVEHVADTDTPVFISACLSPKQPGLLEKCPGELDYSIVYNGDDQVARDDAADGIALRLGGGMAALLVAMLAWLRPKKDIVEGLEDRAESHPRTLRWAWALLAIPVVAFFVALLFTASHAPSTWASGRVGFAVAISVMAAWLFYLTTQLLRRTNTLAALGPVLATPRKTLAEASGTVELSVRAKLRNGGVRAFIGNDRVAYSEVKIWETYTQGKNTSKQLAVESRQRNELGVVDESSEGTLNLQRSILEVELRRETWARTLPASYAERGIVPYPHPRHVEWKVEERVIKDGEALFVFGDVSGIVLQSDEGGYRSVRGSPTLGGADASPVLVYSGSQTGLVAMLTREARVANSFAVVAICLCGAMALSLGALAML